MQKRIVTAVLVFATFITASCGGGGGTNSGSTGPSATPSAGSTAVTLDVARTAVTIDSGLPSSLAAVVARVVTPLDAQPVGAAIILPVSSSADESIILALDASNNIVLAALATSSPVNLSADSTALALTRLALGALASTASAAQVNAAIRASAGYPALVSAVTSALAASTPPSTVTAVFNAISTVIAQIPADVLATMVPQRHGVKAPAAQAAQVAQPSVTTQLPYSILSTSALGLSFSVAATGATLGDGGVDLLNTMPIFWAAASADTNGTSITCASTSPSANNPDCSVLLPSAGLVKSLAISASGIANGIASGLVSTAVPGNGDAFNVTLEQTVTSRTATIVQTAEDIFQVGFAVVTAGKISPAIATCLAGTVQVYLPPAQVATLALSPSAAAFASYLKSFASVGNFYSVVSKCIPGGFSGAFKSLFGAQSSGAAAPNPTLAAVAAFFSNMATAAAGAGLQAAGIPLEITELVVYWSYTRGVGVCEARDTLGFLQLANCAASFQFAPASLTIIPGQSATPVLTALDASGNSTATPADLVFSSAEPNIATVDATSGTVTGNPALSGMSTPINITVTDRSTGVSGMYAITVDSVPTMSAASSPTGLPPGGGPVTLSATLTQPSGAIAGTPYPTGSVTFLDQNGAALCTASIAVQANPGTASCSASITSVPDTITAQYSGDDSYTPLLVPLTVTSTSATPKLLVLDYPGASETYAVGINDAGTVVGYWSGATAGVFFFSYQNGVYTALPQLPGIPSGINNNGVIVGNFVDTKGYHGYIYSGGSYTTLDFPGAAQGTFARAISNAGAVVGSYLDASSVVHGFLYTNGAYSAVLGGVAYTEALGINASGVIVGYTGNAATSVGFSTGPPGTLNVPGTLTTDPTLGGPTSGSAALGINDAGTIIGFYSAPNTNRAQFPSVDYFFAGYQYAGGVYTTILFPGTEWTNPSGINNNGVIVGFFVDRVTTHGFVLTP